MLATIVLILMLILGLVALGSGVRIINEYERGVVFRLGRLIHLKGPGLRLVIPYGIDRLVKVDLRTVTLEVPPQDSITIDNVTVRVLAVIYFQVVSPADAVTKVINHFNATSQSAQSALRSVVGEMTLHDLLSEREKVTGRLQRTLDQQTEPWGVKVTAVEIKDVELPSSMQRAMAREAEAERERRAKIIHAQGEWDAAQRLAEAAHVIATEPSALQLRYLQTLTEIGVERNTVIVFPMPMDLVEPLINLKYRAQDRADRGGPTDPGARSVALPSRAGAPPGASPQTAGTPGVAAHAHMVSPDVADVPRSTLGYTGQGPTPARNGEGGTAPAGHGALYPGVPQPVAPMAPYAPPAQQPPVPPAPPGPGQAPGASAHVQPLTLGGPPHPGHPAGTSAGDHPAALASTEAAQRAAWEAMQADPTGWSRRRDMGGAAGHIPVSPWTGMPGDGQNDSHDGGTPQP